MRWVLFVATTLKKKNVFGIVMITQSVDEVPASQAGGPEFE